jgi:hypothetical protein
MGNFEIRKGGASVLCTRDKWTLVSVPNSEGESVNDPCVPVVGIMGDERLHEVCLRVTAGWIREVSDWNYRHGLMDRCLTEREVETLVMTAGVAMHEAHSAIVSGLLERMAGMVPGWMCIEDKQQRREAVRSMVLDRAKDAAESRGGTVEQVREVIRRMGEWFDENGGDEWTGDGEEETSVDAITQEMRDARDSIVDEVVGTEPSPEGNMRANLRWLRHQLPHSMSVEERAVLLAEVDAIMQEHYAADRAECGRMIRRHLRDRGVLLKGQGEGIVGVFQAIATD